MKISFSYIVWSSFQRNLFFVFLFLRVKRGQTIENLMKFMKTS